MALVLNGIGVGLLTASLRMKQLYGVQLYYQPDHLTLTHENYMLMVDGAIEKLKAAGILEEMKEKAISVEIILLKELEETFPCNPK